HDEGDRRALHESTTGPTRCLHFSCECSHGGTLDRCGECACVERNGCRMHRIHAATLPPPRERGPTEQSALDRHEVGGPDAQSTWRNRWARNGRIAGLSVYVRVRAASG